MPSLQFIWINSQNVNYFFKKNMVRSYCDDQSCISLASMARLSSQDEIDDFSIIDVNESPSITT